MSGDGCTASCDGEDGWLCNSKGCHPICSDGKVVASEVCDNTQPAPGQPYCKDDCSGPGSATCGDGIIQDETNGVFSSESCDTGGVVDPGCAACDVVFGHVCTGVPSVCGQTGLAPDKLMSELTEDEKLAFCTWLTAVLGGEGEKHTCGSKEYTIYSAATCAGNLDASSFGTCTVGAVEQYMTTLGGICSALTSSGFC